MTARGVASHRALEAGLLLQHRQFGACKVIELRANQVRIRLCENGSELIYTREAVQGRDFDRLRMSAGDLALGPDGPCDVSHALASEDANAPLTYVVKNRADGLSARISEIDLTPLAQGLGDTLDRRLRSGKVDPFPLFHARHQLLTAFNKMNRQVGGLHALLASRVDLHPHQAFVAGTVILDPVRRYILADEVGLGKTIEAGIIIHDLLARRSDARVLILTPGPLCRQWLCEMHSSFGGQGFRLADLHDIENIDLEGWRKIICSTDLALAALEQDLLNVDWDMVIVDEVHHLLNAPHLYAFIQQLSQDCRDLLLLSAVPMRRREKELFKLLALLEPETYGADRHGEAEFLALYQAQAALGRRLNLLSGDLRDLADGTASAEDVLDRIDRMLTEPLLAKDAGLQALRTGVAERPVEALAIGERFHAAVSDRYRVNRRMLRNRRERLISEERLTAIRRVGVLCGYTPDQIEIDVVDAIERLIADLHTKARVEPEIRQTLARILLQALASPDAVATLLDALAQTKAAKVNAYGLEMLGGVVGLGGESWERITEAVFAGSIAHLDPHLLSDARQAARRWVRSGSSRRRWAALLEHLRGAVERGEKTLVFLGFPGAAEALIDYLEEAFGPGCITEFRSELDDMVKEENVRRFRSDPWTLIMVSDESGGEGRNFQFAHSLVHADLPWQAAVIEQRIGRLDRLGRELFSREVPSLVVYNEHALEAGLAHCYDEGLKLFSSSLSGLEFALRGLQDDILDTALTAGAEGLYAMAPALEERATEERVRDDSEALLDEASYHAGRAERFLRVNSADVEEGFESSFTTYLRLIANNNAVWKHSTKDCPTGLWGFRPDEIRRGEVELADRDSAGALGKRIGTFRRDLAQSRRDLEFFSYGNPLVDAVSRALTERLTGRTYAISVRAPEYAKFVGVEAVITARPATGEEDLSPSLATLADALFGYRRRPVFVPLSAQMAVDGPGLSELRMRLSPTGGGSQWSELDAAAVRRFEEQEAGDLEACLERLFQVEIPAAKAELEESLAEPIAAERQRIAAHLTYLQGRQDAAASREREELTRYESMIANWSIELDGLGFLAVNAKS